jgi:hypothetical protein
MYSEQVYLRYAVLQYKNRAQRKINFNSKFHKCMAKTKKAVLPVVKKKELRKSSEIELSNEVLGTTKSAGGRKLYQCLKL